LAYAGFWLKLTKRSVIGADGYRRVARMREATSGFVAPLDFADRMRPSGELLMSEMSQKGGVVGSFTATHARNRLTVLC
jgi:hypothetical protein